MSAKKEKGKNKAVKTPRNEDSARLAPVNIHFKITTIKNFQHFYKLSGEFSLELYHCKKMLNATNPDGGKFYLCRCPSDSLLLEEGADVLDINLHYVLSVKPDNFDELLLLADCPILIVLNLFTDETYEHKEDKNADKTTMKYDGLVKSKIIKNKKDIKSSTLNVKNKEEEKGDSKIKKDGSRDVEKSIKLDEGQEKNVEKEKKGQQKDKSPQTKKEDLADKGKVTEDKSKDKKQKEEEPKGVEEESTLYKIPIGFGIYDLLNLITSNPIDTTTEMYLYPEFIYSNIKTPKIVMQIYSVLGILQNSPLKFCNIASLTMESLYNIPDVMKEPDTRVHVDFSLIQTSEMPNRHKLFTFSDGNLTEFEIRERHYRWGGLPNIGGVGALTPYLGTNELKGIYVDDFEILSDVQKDSPIYTFDLIHRYFFTEDDVINFEHLINYTWYQINVEIRINDEEEPKFIGLADLSPLLYPDVRKGKFCVVFKPQIKENELMTMVSTITFAKQPPSMKTSPKSKSILPGDFIPTTARKSPKQVNKEKEGKKGKKPPKKRQETIDKEPEKKENISKQLFGIFTVEFYKPITERSMSAECDATKITSLKCYCEEVPHIPLEKLAKIAESDFENEVITIVKELPSYVENVILNSDNGPRIDCQAFKKLSCYQDMKENLVDRITKVVGTKYNVQNPTKTNQEFKDLMVTVFNDLGFKIETIVNDYFAGIDACVEVSRVDESKDIRIFTAKEARELSFKHIVDSIWNYFLDEEEEENDIVAMIIKELEILNLDEASYWLSKLINIDANNYYGMIISLYFTYLEKEEETEIWLNDLMKLTKAHPIRIEVWALLYVVFSQFGYRPGFKYAKMNYELKYPPEKYPHFWERIEMFYNVPETKNPLCYSVYVFLKIGLYKFAEIVYDFCKDNFNEFQRRYLQCAILYLQNNIKELTAYLKSISSEQNEILVKLFQGHMKYDDDDKFGAVMDYQVSYHSPLRHDDYYHVAFLRCGYWDIQNKNYTDAKTYFYTCCKESNSFLSWYGLGICCYKLGELKEAEICFSKATNMHSKVAEVWIYLAIINLKTGHYSRAKECCETARTHALCDKELWEEMISTFIEKNVKVPPEF